MNKNIRKSVKFRSKKIKSFFTGSRLTKYAGLSPIMQYIEKHGIDSSLNSLFPTINYNSLKFSKVQILLSILLASLSGVSRIVKIANFTKDCLVTSLLNLKKCINKDAISTLLKKLGQAGAFRLQEYLLDFTRRYLSEVNLNSLTIDADSTVKTVYGKQQGAAKGFNSTKKGAFSYHPLLAFASELKIVLNSWFRTGSAYTSNGICEFIKQTEAFIPENIKEVFFRADSGFFNGVLFDLLEELEWKYLIKVKLKNLNDILIHQEWEDIQGFGNVSVCEFEYQAKSWKKSRKLRAIRTIKKWIRTEFFGKIVFVPEYEYACYCSNLEGNAFYLHEIYKQRSTSETWIEQVKSQLLAGKTLTDDFHANDILWQLNVFAYNVSVMMRYRIKQLWRQEHETFRDWFINLPAKLVKGGRVITAKLYKHYYYKDIWIRFEKVLLA